MLKCAVLYTENDGVFLFHDYKLSGNTLKFNKIKSTAGNELSKLLNKNKEIEIIDKNKINLNNKIIENVGFIVFEYNAHLV